ncbi:SNF2 family N-terminal domain-containing protein [Russula compacta]|nr:SNF2 family N-terminal domain-containing protein [Russula compacta]
MGEPGPSRSRILAALDLTEDDSSSHASAPTPTLPSSLSSLLSRQLGEKRKRGAEYISAIAAPVNKRQTSVSGTSSHSAVNRLPAGLLANIQSPDAVVTDPTLTPEQRSVRETQASITAAFRHASSSASEDPLGAEFRVGYDEQSPLTRLDFGGEDQEKRLAEFVSKSIDNLAQDMHVKDGMKYLGLKDAKDILPGMEVRLIPHQIIGVSWMLMQEKETKYKGGIMADEMGLGKTIQMIATMAKNMPGPDENNRTTLVVVPAALTHQWKEELESKSNDIFSVHIHHGKTKLKSLSALREKDVIITTYQTLCLDFIIKDPHVDADEEAEWLMEHGGLLARMKWYRVVLDEAQFIRNRATRASKVVAQLRAKYRWMLTGTPVTNTLADLYGLIRFGHFRPWNDWQSFYGHIAKVQAQDAPLAGARAQSILKPILLRRTKDSKLDGKPLLTLPPKSIEVETLQFSSDEREIYDDFEKQAKIRVNRFIRERTIIQNHSVVLVMILRLRQLCCHPKLILSQAEEYDDPTLLVGSESDKELARARRVMGSEWVVKLKGRALARARAIELDFTNGEDEEDTMCPVCHEIYENNGRILKCGHELCADCLEDMSQSAIVHDGIFGFGDERQNILVEKQFEEAAAKGFRPCPVCKKMNDVTPNAIFLSSAFEPSPEELRAFVRTEKERSRPSQDRKPLLVPSTSKPASRRPPPAEFVELSSDEEMPDFSEILARSKPKKEAKVKEKPPALDLLDTSDDESGEVKSENRGMPASSQKGKEPLRDEIRKLSQRTVATWRQGDDDMEPSAKMLALLHQLRTAEDAGDKTIVYSQWTSMLNLLETLLARHGIQNLRYDGKMRSEAREATLSVFRKAGGPRVILISTKCGGVGLNLTSANRVINMDLSWNYAAESQAYDRVHRLGQEKDVFVKRLVVENTIEERMLRLQDVKTGLADAALGEGTGVKLNKLSVREIKALFGMLPSQTPQRPPASQPPAGDSDEDLPYTGPDC